MNRVQRTEPGLHTRCARADVPFWSLEQSEMGQNWRPRAPFPGKDEPRSRAHPDDSHRQKRMPQYGFGIELPRPKMHTQQSGLKKSTGLPSCAAVGGRHPGRVLKSILNRLEKLSRKALAKLAKDAARRAPDRSKPSNIFISPLLASPRSHTNECKCKILQMVARRKITTPKSISE
jgi:hypothetical protein